MKTANAITHAAIACLFTGLALAQVTDTSDSFTETETPQLPPPVISGDPAGLPPVDGIDNPALEGPPDINAVEIAPLAPPPPPPADEPGAAAPEDDQPLVEPIDSGVPPSNEQEADMVEQDGGWRINDAGLNDIFQFLSKAAGRQYFHNMKIAGPEFRVTGHLNDGNPLQQMEDLAFMYGLTMYTKGSTIYALTEAQLNQLPSAEFHYQLQYLRPDDMEQIKELIKPVLSPGTGIVNFEPKTNTIIVIDTAHHIDMARELLHNIDKAKGQIVVETKIFRVLSDTAERVGVDWSGSLGADGTTLELSKSLNAIFGIADALTSIPNNSNTIKYDFDPGASLVLSPLQMGGVLRALSSGGIAQQVSNPTLITEDNEKANISIIDRVPIITTTINQTDVGNNITEEVRYKIDPEDPTISKDPEKHREIGISVGVTPTILGDGTIRMRLRPRSAQIVEQVEAASGNFYPRVSESMIESITRVPDGHSLVVGGFYGEVKSSDKNKVPVLGDIPILNFFFKSRQSVKEQTSLVFIVTPTSYDPTKASSTRSRSATIRSNASLRPDHDWIDPQNPGPAHEANMRRTMRGAANQTAPYYPNPGEQKKKSGWWNRSKTSTSNSSASQSKSRFSRARRR